MNPEKLMDAIGQLPADLIGETERLRSAPRKIPGRRGWLALAACLVLITALGIFSSRLGLLSGMGGQKQAAMEMAPAAMESKTENSITDEAPRWEAEAEEAGPESHPLTLTAVYSEGEVTAQSGNYTLRQVLPDGSLSETVACGAHPLQTNPEPTMVSDGEVRLCWAIAPEEITVRSWPAGADPETPAEEHIPEANLLTLLPGSRVYEITARWGEECTASYALRLDWLE